MNARRLPASSPRGSIAGNDLKLQAGYVYGQTDDTVTGGPATATASGVRSQVQV